MSPPFCGGDTLETAPRDSLRSYSPHPLYNVRDPEVCDAGFDLDQVSAKSVQRAQRPFGRPR